ncbi:MAG: hypothetical protein A2087_12955 [Spirochaetes bacterium GWD1_61_31]|nr:MAG: hypothetical protein A2Y37_05580 [Spirochaetes bacterium GWB1_60_80]OHD34388.1 MAG: hypothetical protein A2004_06935 [Spirochaetes bacterium GWC1_61_12]OHD35624.1 MAG: hypothetical protein A2087_12955 [Spirochaetes bacterium GWD1_61_31]OHD41662.1 MAG: hypothetical protein A2Y35_08970 [Spirochaetes bacterium GWE1_60_18]OHD61677.1 MAG: hypothetical protein A2Y32_03040 [Spirochaetes bacterium GWF1_60_12]
MPNGTGHLETEYLVTLAIQNKTAIQAKLPDSAWTVQFLKLDGDTLRIGHGIPFGLLRKNLAIEFSWQQDSNQLLFTSTLTEPGSKLLGVKAPTRIVKTLNRNFDRVKPPASLQVSFSVAGTRYDLDFPQLESSGKPATAPELNSAFDLNDLRGLIQEFSRQSANLAEERKIIMFRDRKPENLAERLCTASGQVLYIPSLFGGLPVSNPFSDHSILTRSETARWLKQLDIDASQDSESWRVLEHSLRNRKLKSLVYIPIIFQHYTIGLLYLGVPADSAKPPLDLETIENFMQFARVLAQALQAHGYFKDAPTLDNDFKATIVNISAGGLLFATTDKAMIQQLQDGNSVSVQIRTAQRSVSAAGLVKRHFAETASGYFGLQFNSMAIEDFRYLFEYLYQRPMTDADAGSVEISRILANR